MKNCEKYKTPETRAIAFVKLRPIEPSTIVKNAIKDYTRWLEEEFHPLPKLKSCQFCKKKNTVHIDTDHNSKFFAYCESCHARSCSCPTKEDAILIWNEIKLPATPSPE